MNGNFEFYQELKSLASDPQLLYAQLKQELQAAECWKSRELYRRLIDEEHDTAEQLEYIRKNPEAVETYAKDLIGLYEQEVLKIYKGYINQIADRSSNRKGYQNVCGIIRRYGKLAGKQLQHEVVNELSDRYRRKPAFVDELGNFY